MSRNLRSPTRAAMAGSGLLAVLTIAHAPAHAVSQGNADIRRPPLATATIPGDARCGQPVTTGATPTASDCLFILRVAVGIDACPLPCVCDLNGDLRVSATDSLSCLNVAVGSGAPLECPCAATTTTLGGAMGVCCLAGTCSIVAPADCAGVYLRDSTAAGCSRSDVRECSRVAASTSTTTTTTVNPPTTTNTTLESPRGVCCDRKGTCIITTPDACVGTYQGDSENEACSAEEQGLCASRR